MNAVISADFDTEFETAFQIAPELKYEHCLCMTTLLAHALHNV